jgi:hypothetical protein
MRKPRSQTRALRRGDEVKVNIVGKRKDPAYRLQQPVGTVNWLVRFRFSLRILCVFGISAVSVPVRLTAETQRSQRLRREILLAKTPSIGNELDDGRPYRVPTSRGNDPLARRVLPNSGRPANGSTTAGHQSTLTDRMQQTQTDRVELPAPADLHRQKRNFNANCMSRGSPDSVEMRPNEPLEAFLSGSPNCAWLNALNTSQRSSNFRFSPK